MIRPSTIPATSRFVSVPDWCTPVEGTVTAPAGFRAAGVSSGVKGSGRRDVGILVSDAPSVSAAFFTRNAAAAAPVLVTRDSCATEQLRAIVVSSGNANACTGSRGLADAMAMRAQTAGALGLPVRLVAVASTGVIGEPMPMRLVTAGIDKAAKRLAASGGRHFAAAIRTTDRSAKEWAVAVETDDGTVHLGFAAKGAGMISPNMATTLSFVTCDAVLEAADWRRMMSHALAMSFNRISVDGQESTNDTMLGLANGASGVSIGDRGREQLEAALTAGLTAMALAVVADGEGATHTVRLVVRGGVDDAEAERVARAVATSPLVKTAIFGRDVNWGRIVQAAGMALGAGGHRAVACDVAMNGIFLVFDGDRVPLTDLDVRDLEAASCEREIDMLVDLRRGTGRSTIFFSDLTHDYVRLNAGYRT